MDELDRLIRAKTADLDLLEKEIATLELRMAEIGQRRKDRLEARTLLSVELAAFQRAASLRPAAPSEGAVTQDEGEAEDKRRGRQPGAISQDWRDVLGLMSQVGGRHKYEAILVIAQQHGIDTSLPSVRDRVRKYVGQKFLEGDADIGFKVTPDAIARFGLPAAPRAEEDMVLTNELFVSDSDMALNETPQAEQPDEMKAAGVFT